MHDTNIKLCLGYIQIFTCKVANLFGSGLDIGNGKNKGGRLQVRRSPAFRIE